MLFTIGQLSNEFPEISDELMSRLQDADLKIPAKPPVKLGSTSNKSRQGTRATRDDDILSLQSSNSGMRNNNQNIPGNENSSVLSLRSYELEI